MSDPWSMPWLKSGVIASQSKANLALNHGQNRSSKARVISLPNCPQQPPQLRPVLFWAKHFRFLQSCFFRMCTGSLFTLNTESMVFIRVLQFSGWISEWFHPFKKLKNRCPSPLALLRYLYLERHLHKNRRKRPKWPLESLCPTISFFSPWIVTSLIS